MRNLGKAITAMILKDLTLEWRNRYALNGILLYTASSIFICYLAFQYGQALTPIVWNTLFWIIMLFAAMNAVAKSFFQESTNRHYYYFFLSSPEALILSKIIYNAGLMLILSLLGYLMFSITLGNPVQDKLLYLIVIVLAAFGFAGTLTMISGIASKAGNNAVLMAVLSFPVILPMLLMVIKSSKNAMDGLDWSASADEVLILVSINLIIVTLSYMLFPYLWRS